MDTAFARYLLAKQTVDDRALNRGVFEALKAGVSGRPLSVVEVGGGIGTMLARLVRWGALGQADYTIVDQLPECIAYAREWLPSWAEGIGLGVERGATLEAGDEPRLRLRGEGQDLKVRLVRADVFEHVDSGPPPADLLIAHAFLDLLDMPEGLHRLLHLVRPGGLAWLTINFDGVSTLEPTLDATLDAEIERVYHLTMDTRRTGGDSRSGRHLFGHLGAAGAEILAAGPSDWVVFGRQGRYPAEEASFLQTILGFYEEVLTGRPELEPGALARWLAQRRAQIDAGELVYIAHQMDFLVRVNVRPRAG
jgi:SAM-dependent methyltransferase